MRNFTTAEQTAELKKRSPFCRDYKLPLSDQPVIAYSIGELIRELPRVIKDSGFTYCLQIEAWDIDVWRVCYTDDTCALYDYYAEELIDALYSMVVKLTEEGRI